jgi:hypothetical protein
LIPGRPNKVFGTPEGSRPALGTTEPSVGWVPEIKWPDHELTTHLNIMRRLGTTGNIPHIPSWLGEGIFLYQLCINKGKFRDVLKKNVFL